MSPWTSDSKFMLYDFLKTGAAEEIEYLQSVDGGDPVPLYSEASVGAAAVSPSGQYASLTWSNSAQTAGGYLLCDVRRAECSPFDGVAVFLTAPSDDRLLRWDSALGLHLVDPATSKETLVTDQPVAHFDLR